MRIDHYFDAIYLGLNIGLLAGLALAVVFGAITWRTRTVLRTLGAGVALIAIGTAVALAGGLIADAALRSSPWFQQVRFGTYYLGFTAVVAGTILAMRGTTDSPRVRRIGHALAIVFLTAVGIGVAFVTIPSTFVLNQYREQIQLAVYWLPVLVATAGGCAALIATFLKAPAGTKARLVLVAVFEGLLFVGLLREAEILPDLGDPLTNLLVAFIPFVVGGGCLAFASAPNRARSRKSSDRKPQLR
jgi:hypothetical protein